MIGFLREREKAGEEAVQVYYFGYKEIMAIDLCLLIPE